MAVNDVAGGKRVSCMRYSSWISEL